MGGPCALSFNGQIACSDCLLAGVSLRGLSRRCPHLPGDTQARWCFLHLHPPAGTTKRPVPLQHNLYYSGQLYTICQGEQYRMEVGTQYRCGYHWYRGVAAEDCSAAKIVGNVKRLALPALPLCRASAQHAKRSVPSRAQHHRWVAADWAGGLSCAKCQQTRKVHALQG